MGVQQKESQSLEEIRLTDWFRNLATQFRASIAHQFILHGNITDLVPNPDVDDEPDKPHIPLRHFLEKTFEEYSMVIFYNIASGLRFLSPSMETEFKKIAGIKDDDKASQNPLVKAGVIQKKGIPRTPEGCLPLIEKVLKNQERAAVIINFTHHIAPAAGTGVSLSPNDRVNTEMLIRWGQDEEIRDKGNIILLLTDQLANISAQLRLSSSGTKTVCVTKPSKEKRKVFLQSIIKNKTFSVPRSFNLNVFSLATQGMNYRQIFEIFLRAREVKEEISLEYVKEKKRDILNAEYGDLLEIIEPTMGLDDLGGLEHIKRRFGIILKAIESGNARLVPMGITLMGPPGTGKTAIVEALAKEAGFNFVKVRNIRNMFVGASEGRMEKMMYALRSLTPVVVMNDEAEQMESSRDEYSGDSGVSNRLRKAWMEFLSDPKIQGKVLIINCTNRPDLIDVALKRSGRSDDRVPMLMPPKEGREAIFKVLFRFLEVPKTITDFSKEAELTDGFSGADIKKIIEEAYRFAFEQGKNKVDKTILKEAIEDFVPSASQAEIDRMTLMAIRECSSRRLLPANIKEIIEKIKDRGLVKVDESIAKVLGNNN